MGIDGKCRTCGRPAVVRDTALQDAAVSSEDYCERHVPADFGAALLGTMHWIWANPQRRESALQCIVAQTGRDRAEVERTIDDGIRRLRGE